MSFTIIFFNFFSYLIIKYLYSAIIEVRKGFVSIFLCSFCLSIVFGSFVLPPLTLFGNGLLVKYPNSYYLKWLSYSLIESIWNFFFLMSNISLFVILPFGYFLYETAGIGVDCDFSFRLYEALILFALVFLLFVGLLFMGYSLSWGVAASWIDYSLFTYLSVSWFGSFLLLVFAPKGISHLTKFSTTLFKSYRKLTNLNEMEIELKKNYYLYKLKKIHRSIAILSIANRKDKLKNSLEILEDDENLTAIFPPIPTVVPSPFTHPLNRHPELEYFLAQSENFHPYTEKNQVYLNQSENHHPYTENNSVYMKNIDFLYQSENFHPYIENNSVYADGDEMPCDSVDLFEDLVRQQRYWSLRLRSIEWRLGQCRKRRAASENRGFNSSSAMWLLRNMSATIFVILNLIFPALLVFRVLKTFILPFVKYLPLTACKYLNDNYWNEPAFSWIRDLFEVLLFSYFTISAVVGLYITFPNFRPLLQKTDLHILYANVYLLLIMSSSLPIVNFILGVISSEMIGFYKDFSGQNQFFVITLMKLLFCSILIYSYINMLPWMKILKKSRHLFKSKFNLN